MIGIFDSGSGGLTILRALRVRAPLADIIYFGDLANMPYGGTGVTRIIVSAENEIFKKRAQEFSPHVLALIHT